MADSPFERIVDVVPGAADELMAQGYALFFAEIMHEPLLELLLAMRMSSEPERTVEA